MRSSEGVIKLSRIKLGLRWGFSHQLSCSPLPAGTVHICVYLIKNVELLLLFLIVGIILFDVCVGDVSKI